MTDYLPSKASMPLVMMRETAGIQLAFDYKSEKDAMKKMRIALLLSPFMTAMFANSPLKNNKDTGYKSYRALAWLNTDNDRTGLISKELFKPDASFEDYVNAVLNIPMIFLNRNEKYYDTGELTFNEFMKKGYKGFRAEINDWLTHSSLFFPDVRLKTYIEIRNHDCVNYELTLACIALWKGIMHSSKALDEISELLKDFTYEDINLLRTLVPKYALDAKVKGIKVSQVAKEIIKISKDFLGEEVVYLEPLESLVNVSKTPADILLAKAAYL
jgi:glutamate--cysteine ligase